MTIHSVSASNEIREGDLVLLWFEAKEVSYLVEVVRGRRVNVHCGKAPSVDEWIGKKFGEVLRCQHDTGYLLKPSTEDLMMKASRESGIIYPKDAAFLMIRLGVVPGSKVLEIGTGSGSLTMALAAAVGPQGSVWTFDRRTDLPQNAVKNLRRAGLLDRVKFHQRADRETLPENDFDMAILDIPTPWEEMDVVHAALKSGGRIAALNPTFNQIEKSAEAMRKLGMIRVEAVELLERPILAREGKTRPVQRMVSHTEFMVFGLKVTSAETAPPIEPKAECPEPPGTTPETGEAPARTDF